MAKRAREQAVKEKRERKREKKAFAAEQRAAGIDPYAVEAVGEPGADGLEIAEPEAEATGSDEPELLP